MTEQELINKIRELKKTQPSDDWLFSARHSLINRIGLSESAKSDAGGGLSFWGWIKQYQSLALTACLMINIIAGPWLLAEASRSSLPGELLYSIKKIGESLQIKVTSNENKSQLQVEFANRRLEELNKIAERLALASKDTEAEQTKQVINDFKNSLASAKEYLNDNVSKEKAVGVAKQAKKMEEGLTKAKEGASKEMQADFAEAEEAIKDIKHQILTVIINSADSNSAATSSDEEIVIYLQDNKNESKTSADCGAKIENDAEKKEN